MLEQTYDAKPSTQDVTFDVRLTVPAEDLPYAVQTLEELAGGEGWSLKYPDGESLPHEHTYPSLSQLDDEGE